MTLRQALTGIKAPTYFKICGYSYTNLTFYGNHTYQELPKDFQDGIIVLINKINEVSKMVYSYELDLTTNYMMNVGIKRKPFYDSCGINKSFHITLNLNRNQQERLMIIRMHLILIMVRLYRFVNHDKV